MRADGFRVQMPFFSFPFLQAILCPQNSPPDRPPREETAAGAGTGMRDNGLGGTVRGSSVLFKTHIDPFLVVSSLSAGGGRFLIKPHFNI